MLANALGVNLVRLDSAERPAGVVLCLVLLTAWTAAATFLYADPARRGPLLLGIDLLVALAMLVATPVVRGPAFDATVPGFWVMAPLLAWAIHYRWTGGLAAGLVIGAVDVALRSSFSLGVYGNVFLLVVGGPVVGYLSGSLQDMADERDRAQRDAAAAAERARLARAVHDGVLQVLALVQRRGHELGPDGAELARRAGEQESVLRELIRAQDAMRPEGVGGGGGAAVDVADQVARLGGRPGVEVATPGEPVLLPAPTAAELVAAAVACLDNVDQHAGADARAWVLLEDLGDRVEVSVRDDGPGIAEGRLDEAAAQGRLGVVESIRGRVTDLGGRADLHSGPDGTEWSLVVPRPGPGEREGPEPGRGAAR